ncbi:aldehyde dehydrogenase family protein [Amycolatopsis jiangsuensis]|uniref:Acyl-CoA reductase-like NAD-dependent aldehyde dehydrogenase n=1 Tax=Amycolatopsis jiangsuensis TaxID=1181879 RepID=A0A840ITJ8_9PSEU|nr:aldehyde dehydrogenase family protein [Amycolatopsis jiangsuensis]MBB4685971.1 acyl-CoA reductase-like NAD-dependent aldehyde dehydrogenase [Amycolatopsis jiangsuensis]
MTVPFWVAGKPATGTGTTAVRHPFDGSTAGSHHLPGPSDVEAAVQSAADVADDFATLPAHVRAGALDHISRRLSERAEEIADLITAESGKPLKWSRGEVGRAVSTFHWAAEEARRFSGELQRLDTDPGGTGRLALVRRVPKGPVLGITPFNFPLNLVAHKVAPAIAVGAPIVLKPAPATPLTALLLGEILAETALPAGSWSILPLGNDETAELVRDPRLPVVSFTGSVPVGWAIRDSVPRKHVALELGGNGAVLVCPDWTDLDFAARRIATFAMYQAGQSCISVQRVYAHTDIYDTLQEKVLAEVAALRTGNPREDGVDVGPLINETAATRVESWVSEATAAGATVLAGGRRSGATVEPTVLADVPEDASVMADEVFGPVVSLVRVSSVDDGVARINASRFGLQAGVFTRDLPTAFDVSARLKVGGVLVGDVPSFRADQMPYGGVKDSGRGREGPAAAMADFTEDRVTVLTGLTL